MGELRKVEPCKDAASYFAALGISVIPLRAGCKRPAGQWMEAQSRRASGEQIATWPAGCNVGIVCGAISGLVVVDCESRDDAAWFYRHRARSSVIVQTRRGYHLYFRHPGGTVRNGVRIEGRYDLRADGGYVVGPPSTIGGHTYRFIPGHGLRDVANLPAFNTAWLPRPHVVTLPPDATSSPEAGRRSATIRDGLAYIAKIYAVSGHGGHNATFRAANKLRESGMAPPDALAALSEWNKTNADPPWSEAELLHKIRDVFRQSAVM